MSTPHVLILAAGKGTRMKSARPKVLHHVAGAPMIDYVLDDRRRARRRDAHGGGRARGRRRCRRRWPLTPTCGSCCRNRSSEPPTPFRQAAPLFAGVDGTLVLLSGDVPLLSVDTLRALLARHEETGAAATILTAVVDNPFGYGRIVRDGDAVRASSNSATRRRPSGRFAKSTPASTRSTSSRCSRRSARSPRTTRSRSTT